MPRFKNLLYQIVLLFTCVNGMSGAAEKSIPKCIKVKISDFISGAKLKQKILLSERELFTGETFEALTHKAFESGEPLALAILLCQESGRLSMKAYDAYSLLSKRGSYAQEVFANQEAFRRAFIPVLQNQLKSCTYVIPSIFPIRTGLVYIGPGYRNMPHVEASMSSDSDFLGRDISIQGLESLFWRFKLAGEERALGALGLLYANGIESCKAKERLKVANIAKFLLE